MCMCSGDMMYTEDVVEQSVRIEWITVCCNWQQY